MSTTPQWIMIGGEGPESYNQHSSYQGALLEAAKEKMNEAISAKLSLNLISERFNVADFGCASGPNTFVAVQNVIDAVEDKYRNETGQNLPDNFEFQALFNDSCNNDFNTHRAYLDQYSIDTKTLLDARAEEVVPGGLMLIFGSCLRDGVKMSETSKGLVMDCIGASFNDLAQQGLVEQDKVDSFSTPLYAAEEGELRQIIKENGNFTVEAFEDIIHPNGEFELDPKILAASFKATFGAFLSAHFGEQLQGKALNLSRSRYRNTFFASRMQFLIKN
ncbi:unnamed protein product [Microthlaspi erraticum]|uniref:Uncharacterized protein n=1 Tax=Microthlaspi erraticum TaxID=1685480 RepID=A0A6D2IXW6_9BRAS|nr:unnamed protein product [Microthlaspi erraticum]